MFITEQRIHYESKTQTIREGVKIKPAAKPEK